MASRISQELGTPVTSLLNEVPKEWAVHDVYCQLIPCESAKIQTYGMIPRLYAFEISYKGILVYSKLLTKQWPYIPAVAK